MAGYSYLTGKVRFADNSRTNQQILGVVREMAPLCQRPQALNVVAVFGLADLLADGPRSADELAQTTGSHARTLYRVLRTLVAAGVFAEDRRVAFA
jgi:predicted Rossmann fold nucleotide-binding protein DprA/Smf involved in DNA uptake